MINLASAPISAITGDEARHRDWGVGITVAIMRTIARHGMTKGAAFFYAVAVGAAANFVLEYIHRHEEVALTAIPAVAHQTVTAPEREHPATMPIVPRAEARMPEPRMPESRPIEHPTTAALPPLPEIKPLPEPAKPVALPQVPSLPLPSNPSTASLPQSADLPTPPLKPTSVPSFNVPPAAPAAASALPSPDKPVEAMSTPLPPPSPAAPSLGAPVSLLPPPDKPADAPDPAPPKPIKPSSGTGGLY